MTGGLISLALLAGCALAAQVSIRVDARKTRGELRPVYAFFGYDEPNYTYMKDGRKLLSQLAELSPVPVYVRAHNLLITGDGTPALKWGSTNAYTEDASGRPRFDWTILDRIFDSYIERRMKPLVEIGFMPEALSVKPQPYQHSFSLDKPRTPIWTGWAYPPKDYGKWAELIYQWVRHSVERYGRAEVESWLWEVWNEPNIGYWQGTPEEYFKLYDYTADAVKRALPVARIGGPHSTGPGSEQAAKFLRAFLEHAVHGKNYATGATGSPLDFVGFHAKGRPQVVEGHVRMGISAQLTDVHRGFEIVASFPQLRGKPVIIGESDPEGCAACSARVYPQNAYRNGTLYPSYTAASFARKHDLAGRHGVNFLGAVTWAFEFEDQPWFDGFRSLATNGIEKPVLNVFRMFGLMGRQRVEAVSTGAVALDEITKAGVRGSPDVGALASRGERSVTIMVWHYHDDDVAGPDAEVALEVAGLSETRVLLHHYRVDRDHSNSYEAWKRMGSPQQP
ncbi:MAG: beta-xylosidase, partial [Acidobacteriota bacterium]